MKPLNPLFASLGTTIFEVMSGLARQHQAINLGQGFPDGNGSPEIVAKAQEALADKPNQYPPMLGLPELRQAVAAHGKRFFGIEADWQSQVIVTSGATEALAASLLGLIAPGDEVVMFEPMYDSYLPIVRLAGGVPKLVRLTPPHWAVPEAELRAAFGPKTKLVLFNTPHNPVGKVFSAAELKLIAELCRTHDALAVCDEVYEHLVFDGAKHRSIMAEPGMAERSVRIGSAGKTFSLTGWKVGYITAAPALMPIIAKVHQFLTFTTPPNLQAAVAWGLGQEEGFFSTLGREMQRKRDLLAAGLTRLGFAVQPSAGTYFLTVDIRSIGYFGSDTDFCKRLTLEAGVAAIPVGAFYDGGLDTPYVRFCFCKDDSTLIGALDRLEPYLKKVNGAW
ncbi:aminotransferase [Elstera sp.]|jgi:aspartate/methionine/tyrosine aminotransferase|uniref:aminotransferase n=1 Tax=Elstera sp. TaxID=1916664 RepID=UPI0037BFF545